MLLIMRIQAAGRVQQHGRRSAGGGGGVAVVDEDGTVRELDEQSNGAARMVATHDHRRRNGQHCNGEVMAWPVRRWQLDNQPAERTDYLRCVRKPSTMAHHDVNMLSDREVEEESLSVHHLRTAVCEADMRSAHRWDGANRGMRWADEHRSPIGSSIGWYEPRDTANPSGSCCCTQRKIPVVIEVVLSAVINLSRVGKDVRMPVSDA
eukprot:6255246-Prymnesium_polylepis.2